MAYDPETGLLTHRIGRKNWIGKVAGYAKHDGYIGVNISGKLHQAHRLIWLYVHGQWPCKYLDHINGNRSDNRIANLREATNSQNQANRRPSPGRVFKGVVLCKKSGKFHAQVACRYLSCHETAEEAARAYDAAALQLYGEFALTNFGR